jgi:hypothetical protein
MTAAVRIEELPSGLDWEAFATRCFPEGRRHNLRAIAAYDAYKRLPREVGGGGETSAVDAWEDEGGATSEGPPGSGQGGGKEG